MIDLADHRPLALYLQQIEKVGEIEAGDIIGIYTCAGGCTHNVNTDDSRAGFGRWTEHAIYRVEQTLNGATGQLVVGINAEDGSLFVESWFHDVAVGSGPACIVFA